MQARYRFVAALLLPAAILAVPLLSHAGQEPVVRWSEIVDLVEGHPAMVRTDAMVDMAHADLVEVKQVENPEIEAGVGFGDPVDGGKGSVVWELRLTIPLDWLAQRKYLKQQSAKGIEAAGHEREALRREVLGELRRLFVTIAYDDELLEALAAGEGHMAEFAGTIEKKVIAGDLRSVELTRVEVEVQRLRLEIEKARSLGRVHKDQLRLWLGGELPDEFSVEFDIEALSEVPDLEEVLAAVGSEHPLVMAGTVKVAASEAGVKAQKNAAFPAIGFGGFVDKELDAMNYGGVVTMSLPLWNWNKGGIDKAKAEKLVAESEQDLLILALELQVISAHAGATLHASAAATYEAEVLPRAAKTVADIQTAYDEGDAELIDLIDARRTLVSTRIDYLDVLLQFHLDVLELDTLTGGLEP